MGLNTDNSGESGISVLALCDAVEESLLSSPKLHLFMKKKLHEF